MTVLGKLTILAALAFATLGIQAAPAELWLHVKVDNPGEDERIRVNVPLALVEQILPLVNAERMKDGRVRIDRGDGGDTDFREIWSAVRRARDGEYASVEDGDTSVKVRKSGGLLLIEAGESRGNSREKVNVRLPLAVVDALFGGDSEELDVLAAVRALGDHAEGVVVDVEDGTERVRIWIDSESAPKD